MNRDLRNVALVLVNAHAIDWDPDRFLGRHEIDQALEWASEHPDRLAGLIGALADMAAVGATQFADIVVRIAEAAGYEPSPDGTRRSLIESAANGSQVLRANRDPNASAFDW